MEYTDLRIQIADVKPGEDDWTFRVTAEDAVTRSKEITEFRLPDRLRSDLRVLTARAAIQASRGLREEDTTVPEIDVQRTAAEIGNELFEALFASNLQKLLDRRRSALEGREDENEPIGLRLRFELNLQHEGQHLIAVPWELLCRGKEFFGLSLETPIVRSLDLGMATNPTPARRPLEILYVRSNPPGTAPLAGLAPEAESLERWDNLTQVNVRKVENATLDQVRRELLETKPHVLHYMGHGDFKGGEGMLAFEDGEVNSQEFCTVLRDFQPRLVVLNACNTGESEVRGGDPFAGMASSLVELGVAAVVAMQKEVDDRAANAFAQRFYETLVGGLPVDAAVAEGRLAIHNHSELRGSPEWATPVLFMQTRYNGILLEGEIVLHRHWRLKRDELSVWLTRDARGRVNLNWHNPKRPFDSDVVALYAEEPDPEYPLRYLMDTATFARNRNDRGEFKHRTGRLADDTEYWAAYLRKQNNAYEIAATSPAWSWNMPT